MMLLLMNSPSTSGTKSSTTTTTTSTTTTARTTTTTEYYNQDREKARYCKKDERKHLWKNRGSLSEWFYHNSNGDSGNCPPKKPRTDTYHNGYNVSIYPNDESFIFIKTLGQRLDLSSSTMTYWLVGCKKKYLIQKFVITSSWKVNIIVHTIKNWPIQTFFMYLKVLFFLSSSPFCLTWDTIRI